MSKNIQMPKEFLVNVFKLILLLDDVEMDEDTKTLCRTIESQIKAKIAAIDRRKTFTEYKTAECGEGREKKRLEYLDKAGIHKDWRSEQETHIDNL